jgi:mannose-6-phosphate isomerase
MDRIRLLRNPIRDYAWGSRSALAELTGRPAPTPTPEAELWMGAHPAAPSQIRADSGWVSLRGWIRRDPKGVLGAETARRFAGELPFLFKVLAPERALSIQTHPDAQRARAGFERENAAGLGLGDARRSYRDPNPKPELICALTRFRVLCGFRRADEITRGLAALGLASLEPLLAELRSFPERGGLERFFRALMTRGDDERCRLAEAVAEAAARRTRGEPDRVACAWVEELARQHPADVGVLAPLLLNPVELGPGQALYLPAGELHSYLGGVGVELMANSDNVLRGGLTNKHVDVPELLAAISFREGLPPLLEPRAVAEGESVYDAPAREFLLSVLRSSRAAPVSADTRGSVEILLCTEGKAVVRRAAHGDETPLPRGAAALVPAGAGAYRVEGEATLYRAGVPRPQ